MYSMSNICWQCSDLLSQAQYHVASARKIIKEEQELSKHREEEREALRQRHVEEQAEKKKKKVQKEELAKVMMEKRQLYVQKAKQIVLAPEPEERKSKSKVRRINIMGNFYTTFFRFNLVLS